MSFGEGFTTQGVPFVTGSDGQILTWDGATEQWVAGDGIGSITSTVSTSNGITGSGTSSDPVRLKDDITVSNITVTNTASIAHLDTIYQQSLVVGDKYITLMSGASTHALMDGAGVLWGSGSTDGSTGDQGSVAYVLYRNDTDNQLEIFPGLRVSGSLTASAGISGSFIGDASGLINLPTNVDHVLYVAKDGSDTNVGSLSDPFATISGALAYATTNWNDTSSVLIEVGPGTYSQDLTVTRYNTYVRSLAHRYEQRAVTVTGKTLVNYTGSQDKYNRIIGFQGIFFNHNSVTNPTFNISGSRNLTYLKDCYLASNGASSLKIENVTTSSAKISIANCYFLGQSGSSDIISINGGDVKIDSVEVSYAGSVTTGSSNAINITGHSVVAADRMLVELAHSGSAVSVSTTNFGSVNLNLSNASLKIPLAYTEGVVKIAAGNTVSLWNVFLPSNYTIKGAGASSVALYSNITSYVANLASNSATLLPYKENHGDTVVTSLTSSNGIQTPRINGVTSSNYARKDVDNIFLAKNTFTDEATFYKNTFLVPLGLGTPPILSLQEGSSIRIEDQGSLQITGSIGVKDNNITINNGYFSGSGTGISGLTSSNWSGETNNFISDVRNQLSGGTGISYNKTTGEISAVSFAGVLTTGSVTGSGLVGNEIKLKDDVSVVSLSASAGLTGSLLGTASYASLAADSQKLNGRSAGDYAVTGANTFTANQIINNGYLSASNGLYGRLYGTASYALNAGALDGFDSSQFAKTSSNTFVGNQTVNGYISASNGITGSLKGDGSQVANLTGSNWSFNGTSATASFYRDVRNAFSGGSGVGITELADGRYEIRSITSEQGLYSDNSNVLGTGLATDPFRLNSNITASTFSASVGFTGSLNGTASYASNAGALDGFIRSQFATTSSNTFNGNQTVNGRISASSGLTGSLKGDGSQVTNLTGSNWNGGTGSFFDNVQDAFVYGTGITTSSAGDRLLLQIDPLNLNLKSTGSVTGSGVINDEFRLTDNVYIKNELTASSITASYFKTKTGGLFVGNLQGTATTASTLSGYTHEDFAKLNNDVQFNSVTASFSGSGANISGITASNIDNWTSDVRNVFVAGTNIEINDTGDNTYAISSSLTGSGWNGGETAFYADVKSAFVNGTNIEINEVGDGTYAISASLTGSAWNGGETAFYADVRNTFSTAGGIVITPLLDGTYEISSSGGGGGGGISSVYTSGSITGSGLSDNQIRLKDNVNVTTLTASVLSASSLNINYVDFNTSLYNSATPILPDAQIGRAFYNIATGDITTFLNTSGLYLSNGQQLIQKIVNKETSTITKGKVVHISGTITNTDRIGVKLADWSNDSYSANTLGLAMNDIAPDQEGYALVAGTLEKVATNKDGWSQGIILYLSSSGDLTHVKPQAPKHTVSIGQVIREGVSAVGSIYVKIQNGYELDELHDVLVNNASDGDLLIRSGSLWKNTKELTGSYNLDGYLTASKIYVDPNTVNNITVTYAVTASRFLGEGNYAAVNQNNTFLSGNTFNGSQANVFNTVITASEDVAFLKNIRVNGTASIGHIQNIESSALQVGEKLIVLVSGSTEELDLDEAGLLWGSGSNLGTPNDEYAFVRYDVQHSHLHLYPGLYVSGTLTASSNIYTQNSITASTGFSGSSYYGDIFSGSQFTASSGVSSSYIYGTQISASTGFSGSTYYGNTFNGSVISASVAVSSSLFTGSSVRVNNITASSFVSASQYYGSGAGLTGVSSDSAKQTNIIISPPTGSGVAAGKLVAISGSTLVTASNTSADSRLSNFIGVVKEVAGGLYTITVAGIASASNVSTFATGGDIVYVGTLGNASSYASIPDGNYITQVGIASYDVSVSGNIILQPRIFGQK